MLSEASPPFAHKGCVRLTRRHGWMQQESNLNRRKRVSTSMGAGSGISFTNPGIARRTPKRRRSAVAEAWRWLSMPG